MMDAIFYILAGCSIAAAVVAVSRRNPLTCALWLVVCFLAMAGVFALLAAPLIAALQVLVSAGAIMVLILFVIMLVDIKSEVTRPRLLRFGKILGGAGAAYLAIVITIAVAAPPFVEAPTTGEYYRSVTTLGMIVLQRYAMAFEIAGLLILIACVAAISLAKRETKQPLEEELETI